LYFRWFGCAVAGLVVVGLAACGGGGASVTPQTSSSPALTPTPAPDPFPTASGDTFAYGGTQTQTFTLYGTPAPSPASGTPGPTATPWVTVLSQSVTQSTKATGGASFNGQSGLADLATSETDTTAHATTTVASNTYVALTADSSRVDGVDVVEAGTTATDSSGVTQTVDYGSGNGTIEELPEVTDAQWSNTAARTETEDDPSGESTTATYAADGSYTEQVTYSEGGTASADMYSDGSGLYQMPVAGTAGDNSMVTINAPSSSSNGEIVEVTYAIYSTGFPAAGSFQIPVWYPSVPPVLASDTVIDEGAATVPASCGVSAAYAPAGTVQELLENTSRLDTVFGELETITRTSYVSSLYGVLCSVLSDDLKVYYDYSGQTSSIITFNNTPLEETLVTETLGLTSASLAASTSASKTTRTASVVVPRSAPAVPSFASVRAIIARIHLRAAAALHQRLSARSQQ
jgi:hypothetical protein